MKSLLLFLSLFTWANLNAQETKTSIGFSLSPSYSSILYKNDGSFQDSDVDLIKSGTNGELGLSGNFFFQYKLMDKLYATFGLGVQNYSYSTTYYSQTNIEHPTISRETKYSQYYLQLNTSVKYHFYKTFYARAGIAVDLLAEQRANRTETCPTCEYSYQGKDNSGIYNEAMVPASLGLGYELKLNDKLNLMAEVYGSLSLTDGFYSTVFTDQVQIFQGDPLKPHLQQRPYQLGCKIGIIRSF